MRQKIAITPRSLSGGEHPALGLLVRQGYDLVFPAPGRTPTETELLTTVPGCVGWLAGVEPVSGSVLKAANGLRVISRNGTGVDNIDMDMAASLGIAVKRAAGANARGVAELAIGLMLTAFRDIAWSDHRLRSGAWDRRIGIEADGRTLGVVGCGAIGKLVSRMAIGLGMKVSAYDPFPDLSFDPGPDFRFAELDAVMAEADAITLHCPPRDVAIVDGRAIARMRDGVFLINTARSDLIDEAAVLEGLNSGRIAALATDVFPTEPPLPSSLLAHERVIQTPHAGGFTRESVDRATAIAVENLLEALSQ
jgi:D-3-phosphoglycerate dehydrogenase